ncbi:hypothetical protein PIB30_083000 [Stylosanthes scabra]|uniref:Uncharacterized protein n=1 Tax=Stylosanthes scabra TaxID=79078 RepID=A0ABU6ZQR3_9FABA|nr:hypothetical protein [Stylosanthes scabra]
MEDNEAGENNGSRPNKNDKDAGRKRRKVEEEGQENISSSESEYIKSSHESESGSDETFSLLESDLEQTMSDGLVRVKRRTRRMNDYVSIPNPLWQPSEEEEAPHEQPPPQQPHQPCQQQQPQQEYIDISSCSEGEPEPTPIRVLIPKDETYIVPTTEDRIEEGVPSQSVLEVVPIYPIQEVIDISSSSEDEHEPQPKPIKVVVPKVEEGLVTSPSSKLITEVLMSMGQDKGEESKPDSPPDPSIPSFSLNLDWSRPLGI